ncbi:MAG: hypothetical protein EXS16_05730 [Gemmataceae bacterium]|nr:hypothetical protein [Gemmataceae bacterium]
MDLVKLVMLKELLVTTMNVKGNWTCFLDHFGNNHALLKFGERTRDPMLEAILTQTHEADLQNRHRPENGHPRAHPDLRFHSWRVLRRRTDGQRHLPR